VAPAAPLSQPTLRIAIFLIALSATAPISIDMFLPSMPDIAEEFGSSESFLTLGVTLFLVSFAGSQLFYGPASDRWGRRPILFFGLSLYAAGGLICLAANSAEMLVLGRILQGLGGGVGPAMGNAMVLDLFDRQGATKMIGYQAIVMPLAPAIAPIIGGVIAYFLGWRAVFVLLTGFGVLFAAWYAVTLGETRPPRPVERPSLLSSYRVLFGTPSFIGFAMVMGLMFSGQLVFISTSSFVLIDRLGLAPTVFGLCFGFMALGFMGGATISSRLVGKVPGYRLVIGGASLASLATGTMLVLILGGLEHPLLIIVSTFVSAIGIGMSRPSAMAGALLPFPHMAGMASSTLIFSQMTISSGFNVVYSTLVSPGTVALAAGMFAPITLGLFVATLVGMRMRRVEAERVAAEAAG
jgi:MFS transporter, DHA1 family, multidrug resistance protein